MTWQSVPAGEFMARGVASIDPRKFPSEHFDLYSIPAFEGGIPESLAGADIGSSKKCVEPNDVLLSRIVPHIRRCWVVPPAGERRQIASGEWITFRSDAVFPDYLRYFLTSNLFHNQFMQTVSGVGGSLLRARPAEVERIQVPVPPLREQKRIAKILEKADAIRRKRQQAIELADQFLRSVFLDMFGDPVANPKGFDIGTIRDLVESANYGTSAKADPDIGKYPILRMGNITYTGGWDLSDLKYVDLDEKGEKKYLARKRDVLFNRTNSKELVGKTAVFESDQPMAIAGYLIRVRTNDLGNPYYLAAFLNSNYGKALLRNLCKSIVGMANINAQELQDIRIPIPPRSLQEQFEERIAVVCRLQDQMAVLTDRSKELLDSLSQQAFAGQL